jgi:hypothetical protein
MRLVLGKQALLDYWAGRVDREVNQALRLLDSDSRKSVGWHLQQLCPGPSNTREEREAQALGALRRHLTSAVALRISKYDGFCSAGILHIQDASVRVPRNLVAYLEFGAEPNGVPEPGDEDVCSRR